MRITLTPAQFRLLRRAVMLAVAWEESVRDTTEDTKGSWTAPEHRRAKRAISRFGKLQQYLKQKGHADEVRD